MRLTTALLCLVLCALLTACGVSATTPRAHRPPLSPDIPVLLVRGDLPPSVQYERLGPIAVTKGWYGSAEEVLDRLAAEARALGANAVLRVVVGFGPSGFSWAAPQARGMAVHTIAPQVEDVARLVASEWR